MPLAILVDGEPVVLPYGQDATRGEGNDAVTISYASLLASESTREEWGVVILPDPEPEPVRRLIPKSTVQERMELIGKLGPAFAILQAQPILFGRWFAPDWPNVYADDEGLLQVLDAVGCTEEQIAAVTA